MASAHPQPGRRRPRTVDTRCTRPGWCSTARSDGHLDGAEVAHPAEVVADEVDDHHVLGPVLVGQAARVGGGALDRAATRRRRRRADRNRSGDAEATWQPAAGIAHHGAVRRRVALGQGGAEGGHVAAGGHRGREPAGEVHLVHVAGRDRLADRSHAGLELGLGERARPGVAAGGPRHGGPGQGRAGRTLAKRAQIGAPLERAAPRPRSPCESSAARSSVRSTRSVASRPPTTASGIWPATSAATGRAMAGSVRSHLVPAVTRSIPARKAVAPVHVEFTEEHEALRTGRARLRRGRDRAARRGVGPRPPLPGRRRARHGRPRAVRHPVPGGVRRRRRRPHDAVHRHRGAGPGRPLDGHHPRGRRRPRGQPDPPLRHRGAEADLAARPLRRAHARRLRPHRAGGRAATPAAPARRPCSTRRRGSG